MTHRLPLTQLSANETHVEAFKALAHISRLQVFFVLVKPSREMSVGEIQEASRSPVRPCRTILTSCGGPGSSRRRKEERYVYYTGQAAAVSGLVRLLTACC